MCHKYPNHDNVNYAILQANLDYWVSDYQDYCNVRLFGCWTIGLLEYWDYCQSIRLSDYWDVRLLDYWAAGLLGCQTIGLLDSWAVGTFGLSDYWAVGLLGSQTIGPSDYWAVILLGCWTVRLLNLIELGCWI